MNYGILVEEMINIVKYMDQMAANDLAASQSAYNNGYCDALKHLSERLEALIYEYEAICDANNDLL